MPYPLGHHASTIVTNVDIVANVANFIVANVDID